MLLSHNQIITLLNEGVVQKAFTEAVNAASLDIHLGGKILVERYNESGVPVDYRKREKLDMKEVEMDPERGYTLRPGEFILAQSVEVFYLPNDVSCEYKLKSSMARIGLEHLNAGWCDAGWNGSVLTLELKNISQFHNIRIRPGDSIGQMVFFKHEPVSDNASYASRGRYNGDMTVMGIKE